MFVRVSFRVLDAAVAVGKHVGYTLIYIADIVVIEHPLMTVLPITNSFNTTVDTPKLPTGILTFK